MTAPTTEQLPACLDQHVTPTDLIAALDVLRGEVRARAVWCESCQRRHIPAEIPEPWVEVNPAAIPAINSRGRDLVAILLDRIPTHHLANGRVRIVCPTLGEAVTTAALLRSYGTPAYAIQIGGTP